ncbi:TPA: hypothetical protein MJA79_25045 [Klebsiella pneumoniae]|uniref:Uncharacterized protein n=2 Tax=Klebsiella pneumoniae TaxID=573 RepID=A0A377Z469_KLEPO|nr:hypothetical protein [Klebsiella pneumoniae]MBU9719443.1 hypothetical protein [Klebsiella pneumoniae subsp. ozaenae]VFS28337.1 Uncharacterised protein [Serratia liquefaciens]AYJ92334.1 hypothetical protein D9K64_03090 [Klebsiella pneumoniae]SQC22341.1 Uncharacterised protein [Klebsiella pneumoniae]SQC24749.1 Uncharacterised protein [Klebsiella pneumoniae]
METNKFTRHDFSETAFTLMQIIGDNREFEAKNREDYYQSATFSLNQLNALMAIDEAKTIANKRIVITLGGSLSFNLELKNYFDKTAITLSYIDQDEYGKEFLSKDNSYTFTIDENGKLSDVDGALNRRHYHEHFAHIFTLLVEKIIN